MTSSDNTEQSGSGGTTDTNPGEPPPWQRIVGDDGGATPGTGSGTTTADPTAGSAGDTHGDASDTTEAVVPDGDGVPATDSSAPAPGVTDGAATDSVDADGGRAGAPVDGSSEADTQWMTTPSSTSTAGSMWAGAGQNQVPWQQYGAPPQPGEGEAPADVGSGGPLGAQGAEQGRAAGGGSRPISALRRPGRGPRRANLQLKRFDPWSVLKLSLVLGVALFFVWLVAVGVLYTVLGGMGVWDSINGTYDSLVQNDGAATGGPLITAGTVFIAAAVVGAINIVLVSALATVSAFIYNVCADMAGGLEVTLSERE